MSLIDIVKTLGGDLQGPRRAVIPGPGHGPKDRSISLLIGEGGRLIVHSFGRSDWREVLEDLRRRRFIDGDNRLCGAGIGEGYLAPLRVDADRVSAARALWAKGVATVGTLSEAYVRGRAVQRPLPGAEALRHVSDAPLKAYEGRGPCYPALLAAVRDPSGEVTAVEITYLDDRGRRHKRLRTPKKVIGVIPQGAAVRLDPIGVNMLAGEGVFSTLSASERFLRPGWALLSTSRMAVWDPPEGVTSLLIAGDNGRGGLWASRRLEGRLDRLGISHETVFPASRFDDFNTQAQWSTGRRQ